MFWAVVVAGQQRTTEILQWSQWRRWHQAWARYYHYRRRDDADAQEAARVPALAPPTTLDLVWQRLDRVLPTGRRVGRPYAHGRRVILEAIVFVMETGCGWRALPERFPPWQTVYAQLVTWQRAGIWTTIWADLDQPSGPS